jgi:hypothetical protein
MRLSSGGGAGFASVTGRSSIIPAHLTGRIEAMERASSDFYEALNHLSVLDLKALQPTGKYCDLVETIIVLRLLMGD